MRCIEVRQSGNADELVAATRPMPQPAADEIRIRVVAAGVNRPDVLQRKGLYAPPADASDVLGLEVAGYVDACGRDVTVWREGQPVCALTNGGGYADYVVVPSTQCLPIPQGVTLIEAASLPETFFTVWSNVIDRARLRADEHFLVHGGTSGIGITAIQMARVIGARVWATAGSDRKCQACLALGAHTAINYRESDFVEQVRRGTESRGVDVILDMVGGDYINRNIRIASPDGRLVSIAFLRGSKVSLDLMPMMLKRLTLTGSTLRPRSSAEKARIADALRRDFWPHLAKGSIRPVVDSVFALEQVAQAHRRMESGEHIGKIVLSVNDASN